MRNELKNRNSAIANEKLYAVADGTGFEKVMTPSAEGLLSAAAATTTSGRTTPADPAAQQRSALQARMDRLVKPRAYPLFLLEKATEIMESFVADAIELFQSTGLLYGAGNEEDEDEASSATMSSHVKEKIVILGTGWGGASFLKGIDMDRYDVTIISPRNHFVFTPMLAGACVGTVEYRSICEPIREINRRAAYLEATAGAVDIAARTVACETVVCEGNSCLIDAFAVPYDRLLVTVGAQTNTFGIPGVKEHCNFLKTVGDARRIKSALVNCFERANLPHLTDADRVRALTFAVIGAGPTGIEFAAELRDFVEQDGPKYYPRLLKFVRIKVIEASPTILAPFDHSLQQEAIKQMQRVVDIRDPVVRNLLPAQFELTQLLLECSVKEVRDTVILLSDGQEIPYGMAVWAAGIGPIPLTLQVIEALGPEQVAQQDAGRGRLVIDPWMRAIGGHGRIFALGDCACACSATERLPATAQVAAQQGEYLAQLFNKRFEMSPARSAEGIFPPPINVPDRTETTWSDAIAGFATCNGGYAKPFQFLNLGILAYTGGGSALAQVTPAPNAPAVKGSGKLGNAVWKSVYLSKQISWRNRLLVLNDWTNRRLFGRDITRV